MKNARFSQVNWSLEPLIQKDRAYRLGFSNVFLQKELKLRSDGQIAQAFSPNTRQPGTLLKIKKLLDGIESGTYHSKTLSKYLQSN